MKKSQAELVRCTWAANDINIRYHDEEWGVPVRDERRWFEFLILEGAQAGLSWDTILSKRQRYREVFAQFDPAQVAKFDARKKRELLRDPGIIRNRLKIEATIANAHAFLKVQDEFGSFDTYVWNFVGGSPIQNSRQTHRSVPAQTRAIGGVEQGSAEARLSIRWAHNLLRTDASHRPGERSSGDLLPL